MNKKVLIVEDQFVEANDLQLILRKAGYEVCGIARSVPIAREMMKKEQPGLVLLDIFLKGEETGIDLARELKRENIAFIFLSANSNEKILNAAKTTQPYGFLIKPFREKDLLVMLEIASYRHEHSRESELRKAHTLSGDLSGIISDEMAWDKILFHICRALQRYIPFDYITAGFNAIAEDPDHVLSFLRVGFDEYQKIGIPELSTIAGLKGNELANLLKEGLLYQMLSDTFNMRCCTSIVLRLTGGKTYTFSFYSRKEDTYRADHVVLYEELKQQLTGLVENMRKKTGQEKGAATSHPATTEKTTGHHFHGIVGKSHLLFNVFDLISRVAPSDTSVLVLGESGTGKERIADCIHTMSPRKDKLLVKVNCAALPPALIESELFGHEKGSFTGALDKRTGKFEKADNGTIFLDEIGEMPIDLQAKLLRVLQEKYVERIGAKSPTPVNVRIIAATNRNLEKEVAEGHFRLDLYYRLNVFPIELPPLRERAEDIPLLASHFIDHYNHKGGRKITGMSDRALKSLMEYDWPGNIRELENIIERSVLLANGNIIEDIALPAGLIKGIQAKSVSQVKTIHENERDHIIAVLKRCNFRIWGRGGAAEVLNIPPTTLTSKMKKLGIKKIPEE